ncbi:MAG: hypothetical protein D0530_04805 [Methylococcales bacterium]|nr:MAG: hypothetical protein D0530_04805 [Methylococcales bacterium]
MITTYTNLFTALTDKSLAIYKGLINSDQPVWAKAFPSPEGDAKDNNLFDTSAVDKMFSIKEASRTYVAAIDSAEKATDGVRQAVVSKIQAGVLASWQQGYSFRYNRTRLQDIADTAARMKAQNEMIFEELYTKTIEDLDDLQPPLS